MRRPSVPLSGIFVKSLRDQRYAVLAWGAGLAALAFLTLLFFPYMDSLRDFNRLLDQFPQMRSFMGDIASFTSLEGYITSGLLVYLPLILAIYAVQTATGMITEEINAGTMDFLLEHPVPRWRVVLEKYAALVVALLGIALLTALGLWLGDLWIGTGVAPGRWLLAALAPLPLTLLYGSLAFALACAVRGRGLPVGVAATLVVGGFILNGVAPFVDWLRPYRPWTLYYLFTAGKPLTAGLDGGYTATLLALCLLCLAGALFAFTRRDILA